MHGFRAFPVPSRLAQLLFACVHLDSSLPGVELELALRGYDLSCCDREDRA